MSPTLGSDCSPKSYSIYYTENKLWSISLDLDFGYDALTCVDGNKEYTVPDKCTNWDGNKVPYVSAGSCPIWPCDRISVGSIEHITSPCNQQFTKIGNNVYQGLTTTTIYMWFHPRTFKWFCNKIVKQEDCFVMYGPNDVVSAPFQNWHDFIANTEQWTWPTESHGDFIVTCYFETQSPTPAPTTNPIPAPTNYPTPAPTKNPTPSPTKNPTQYPTKNPTPAPTKHPSKHPSES
eukprot:544227_1